MSEAKMGAGPLAGCGVLEVAHFLAGPYSGMLLGDLGADVIKIGTEPGGRGPSDRAPHRF